MKKFDISKARLHLIEAKNMLAPICKEIYEIEVDFDDIILSVNNVSDINMSNEARDIFKIALQINSAISDILDAEINNRYIEGSYEAPFDDETEYSVDQSEE
jgi:hypothetical protein